MGLAGAHHMTIYLNVLSGPTIQALAKHPVLGKTEGIVEQLVLATEVEVGSRYHEHPIFEKVKFEEASLSGRSDSALGSTTLLLSPPLQSKVSKQS